jgi:hypothetical protein
MFAFNETIPGIIQVQHTVSARVQAAHFDKNLTPKTEVWLIHRIFIYFLEKLDHPNKRPLSYTCLSP